MTKITDFSPTEYRYRVLVPEQHQQKTVQKAKQHQQEVQKAAAVAVNTALVDKAAPTTAKATVDSNGSRAWYAWCFYSPWR